MPSVAMKGGIFILATNVPEQEPQKAPVAIAAITLAGLPSDRFLFAGFLPPKSGARCKALAELADVPATLVFYETGPRLAAALSDMSEILGPAREACVARELTKRFEEVRTGTLESLAADYAGAPPKGEVVLLVGRGRSAEVSEEEIEQALDEALEGMSVRDAADHVSGVFGVARRPVYQKAMKRKRDAE